MPKRRYVCVCDKQFHVFDTWKECENFTADKICRFKKFETEEELEEFKKKYENWVGKMYVVIADNEAHSFYHWGECKEFIDENPNCKYKGFTKVEDAQKYINKNIAKELPLNIQDACYCFLSGMANDRVQKFSSVFIAVENEKEQTVNVKLRKTTDKSPLRFSIGELLAAEAAVKWAIKTHKERVILVYSYQGIKLLANGSWTPRKKVMIRYSQVMKDCEEKINIDFIEYPKDSSDKWIIKSQQLAKEAFNHEEEN